MNTTDTIRLSDRLELRPSPPDAATGWSGLYVDGREMNAIAPSTADALIAACNPPRYDLPNGVIHGSDGKFYAPGDVVRTLPDEMWQRMDCRDDQTWRGSNAGAARGRFYGVRPTAANPLQPLPEHTFRLPDGTLACFRRDAAKLWEVGATLVYTDGDKSRPSPSNDDLCPTEVLRVEFPAPPKTERVPWWEAVGRKHQVWGPILSVSADGDGAQIETATHFLPADADGTVEVLLTAAGVSSDR